MKKYILIAALTLLTTPAFAQEVDRNAQMELLKQNFMARQGIQSDDSTPLVDTKEEKRVRQQNEEYRAATLKALNERKIQLQGVR